jgi:hypothetical protein
MHVADAALYEAKRTGKNRYCAAAHTDAVTAPQVHVTAA